jgi:hypothetical protein
MKIKLRHDAGDVSTWNAGKLFRRPRLSSIILPTISATESNSDRVSLFFFGRRLSFCWIFLKKMLAEHRDSRHTSPSCGDRST